MLDLVENKHEGVSRMLDFSRK